LREIDAGDDRRSTFGVSRVPGCDALISRNPAG
jgi:hypothetical protein